MTKTNATNQIGQRITWRNINPGNNVQVGQSLMAIRSNGIASSGQPPRPTLPRHSQQPLCSGDANRRRARRLVDEYESEIKLPYQIANTPLTSDQVIGLFRDADPTATKFGCEIELQSFFHADLDEVAQRLSVK